MLEKLRQPVSNRLPWSLIGEVGVAEEKERDGVILLSPGLGEPGRHQQRFTAARYAIYLQRSVPILTTSP